MSPRGVLILLAAVIAGMAAARSTLPASTVAGAPALWLRQDPPMLSPTPGATPTPAGSPTATPAPTATPIVTPTPTQNPDSLLLRRTPTPGP